MSINKKKPMTNRQKEERNMSQLKNPVALHSIEICHLINDTIRHKHDVWCCTDWHLWRRIEKDKPECKKFSRFNEVINNYRKKVHPQDLVIYMGDLVDGELEDEETKEELRDLLSGLPGKKIMVKGNNDLFDVNFYKSCGFMYVVQAFVWSNVLFTHVPIENAFELNIHGHIHGYKTYWIPYSNQIDVAAFNGRIEPVSLLKLLRSQPIYAKDVKVDETHFNEEYTVFDFETEIKLLDPFPDEEE